MLTSTVSLIAETQGSQLHRQDERWVRGTPTLRQLIEAVNQLMASPDPPKRPIGSVAHEDEGKKTSGAKGKT